MDKMHIVGGHKLEGEVAASGAKNSVLALVFATLLAKGRHRITNVPNLRDINSSRSLLESLGCKVDFTDGALTVDVPEQLEIKAEYDLVRKMRASILCLGPLLARMKKAQVSLPGGCAIGARPINLHLEAFKKMAAEMTIESGYVLAETQQLQGTHIVFDFPTVGGTENVMMGAALADGTTIIENAAREPEIEDLADYLNRMGAIVKGAGTAKITIEGVSELKPAEHATIPDRIEAGTLLLAGAITGGEVTVTNCRPHHLEAFIAKLKTADLKIDMDETAMTVRAHSGFNGVNFTTAPHPGFPTDLQAQFMSLMTQAQGTSVIKEAVFENRFMHVQELLRMNADISVSRNTAVVKGGPGLLEGAPVMATDLRASASLVLAGLVARGETTVSRIYHLDRGYEGLEFKLSRIGAKIKRVS